MLAEAMEYHEIGQHDIAYATVVQLYKSLHQFVVDRGSWKAAWLLTLLEDPYGSEEFGGSPEELAVVGGHLKATSDLHEKVHGKVDPSVVDGDLEADPLEEGKPKRSRGRGRGR